MKILVPLNELIFEFVLREKPAFLTTVSNTLYSMWLVVSELERHCGCLMFLSAERRSNPNSSLQLSQNRASHRVSTRHASKTALFMDFDFHIYEYWKISLIQFIFWFFPTRQEGVYIQWETGVCWLFCVPEEEMGHWLSFNL